MLIPRRQPPIPARWRRPGGAFRGTNVIELDRALAAYLEEWEENPDAALRAALSDLLFAIEEAETWRRAFRASVSFGYARGQGLLPPNPVATKGDGRGD
jgi:hypothetical protein